MTVERPILFSAPMVRALLDGSKTQTRRVMNPQPEPIPPDVQRMKPYDDSGYWWSCAKAQQMVSMHDAHCLSPYGFERDRLWVRETWMQLYDSGNGGLTCLVPSGEASQIALRRAKYRATDKPPENFAAKWKPSIFMPRWASRITLEVAEVRCQRLQDISEEDAKAEGVEIANGHPELGAIIGAGPSYREGFAQLWREINGKRPGCAWSDNPWLWCVSFRRLKP